MGTEWSDRSDDARWDDAPDDADQWDEQFLINSKGGYIEGEGQRVPVTLRPGEYILTRAPFLGVIKTWLVK